MSYRSYLVNHETKKTRSGKNRNKQKPYNKQTDTLIAFDIFLLIFITLY